MKTYKLTKKEWFKVRLARGQEMTGQSAHRTKLVPIDPTEPMLVRGAGKVYYWCMGQQPDAETIKLIARKCPLKAAETFLKHYKPNPKDWPKGFVWPESVDQVKG